MKSKWKPYFRRPNTFLRRSEFLFFAIGVLALGYVGFVLVDAKLYQIYQTWRFQKQLASETAFVGSGEHIAPALAQASRATTDSLGMAGHTGSPLGQIEIRTIGLKAMILEGTDDGTLRKAVGHILGTALPGQAGNVAIAGHRDTFFRPLRNIRRNDEITLTTLNGSYRYRVDSTKIVDPDDIGVLNDSPEAILTLVTCYPFYFVGPAPKRFIVRARRIPG